MRFTSLSATFGTLERRSFAFLPGLNVIEAPNESGKSTLAIFLRTMLYGLSTRDRGLLADKNRFRPWAGAPMRGTLSLESETLGAVTLTRDTTRADSPMGRFAATYTGTGDPVPGLSAADCGETLLGVPCEVYERSAFIRQSGLAINANAELERRIAALITTGEESVSFTEASAALKKQLNARRANARSGLIPTLAQEIDADRATLDELARLRDERAAAEEDLGALGQREAALREALRTHEIADVQEQYAAREYAKRDAETAERRERQFRAMLAEMCVPPQETLSEDRRRLETADELAQQLAEAEQARLDDDAARQAFLAAPKPKPKALSALAVLWLAACAGCIAVSAAVSFTTLLPPAAQNATFVLPVFAVLFGFALRRRRAKRKAYDSRSDELSAALREAEAVCAALKSQRERTMAQVYADLPVGDETSARAYVRENLERYDTLSQLTQDAAAKRQRCELCPRPDLRGVPAYPVTRPAESPEALRAALARVAEQQSAARSRADVAAGQLAALGDVAELEASLAQKQVRLTEAQAEYDAIAMAMDALDRANMTLQSRFSPELGKRAAAYFAALTGGRYDAVVLDRSFRALATEHGESVGHDAALLSQGAGDQLYLAVRLAICDMVLPAERHIPLVLDDALINFDDRRCAAALELLLKLAQTRQILLLTCQHREAAYLAGRENVHYIQNTDIQQIDPTI
jgi:DNA repair exonuclease SbcCD ATPase subunit